jgi:hypothetical protein
MLFDVFCKSSRGKPKFRGKRREFVENCKKQIEALEAVRDSNRERGAHGVGEMVDDGVGVGRLKLAIN